MSFADELRDQRTETEESVRLEADAKYWCNRLTEAVKGGCRQAVREGRHGIYGYVHMYREDGYDTARFVRKLPSIEEFQTGAKAPDDARPQDASGEPGTYETRLYEGYIIPGNAGKLYMLEKMMGEELESLGFTDFRVQKVMLRDIYIVHRQRTSLFSGGVTKKMTTRTATDPVYTLHFSISW